ncbi:MAG: right-handed parallel beta-helix repeat-containing protein [Pseudonocardia sp.]
MTQHTVVRTALALLTATLCLLLSACTPAAPELGPPRDVAPTAPVDPTQPCARPVPTGAQAGQPAPVGLEAGFDRAVNKIVLSAGTGVTLPALSQAINDPTALRETAPSEWLLGANLEILADASLQIAAPTVRWLKVSSGAGGFVSITALGGDLDISGACITSWDPEQGRVDIEYRDGRSFLLARDGAQMTIDRAELRYLGHAEAGSWGLSWRMKGTGGRITNSVVSHNYLGLYTFEVGALVVADNEVHDSVLYGIDPHTGSYNLHIERNLVHHNGKHGIVLAEDCTDSVIRDNIVHSNGHHGIVLYLRSDRNLVEQNESFRNIAQGININESSDNVVRANRVHDNVESGIGVGQTAQDNLVERNEIRDNQQDGVRLFGEATQTDVRDNVIGENVRYGVYIDSDGTFNLVGNAIFGSRAGVLLKGAAAIPEGENDIYDNREGDVRTPDS